MCRRYGGGSWQLCHLSPASSTALESITLTSTDG